MTELVSPMAQDQEFYICDLLSERDVPRAASCAEAEAFLAYRMSSPRIERPSQQEATELISWLKALPKRRKLDKRHLDISR
jgi:hypothetical protein